MKLIKHIIGKITYPNYAVKCETGESFVPCAGLPTLDSNWKLAIDYTYRYCYQKIEQNWLGAWVKTESYLGKRNPL